MFRKKNKSNEPSSNEPNWEDYTSKPNGFKQYIVDRIEFLRSEGNEHALAFDLDAFKAVAPDDLIPDNIRKNVDEKIVPLIKFLLDKLAWDIFGPMFTEMGLSREVIEALTGSPSNGKVIPGLTDSVSRRSKLTDAVDKIYKEILETVSEAIDECVNADSPESLNGIIETLEQAVKDNPVTGHPQASALADLRDATILFQQLFDSNVTSTEEYLTFLNRIIALFIEDEVDSTNKETIEEHSNHPADECQVSGVIHSMKPLQVLYRRIHTTNENDDAGAIPTLSLLVFDAVNNVLHPISFSVHEALTDRASESFNKACRSEAGSRFLISKVMDFINEDKEKHAAFLNLHELDDDEMMGGAIRVAPEVVTPSVSVMKRILSEVQESFGSSSEDVFADLNPSDFI